MSSQVTPADSQFNLASDSLSRQLNWHPVKSFLRLNFHRIIAYLLLDENEQNQSQIETLTDLVDELRATFDALTGDEYEAFARLCLRGRAQQKLPATTRRVARHLDQSYILHWALIEAAKYCSARKLATEATTTNQFLGLLKAQLNQPINCHGRCRRLVLLRFLHYLDKLVLDRTEEFARRAHTLELPEKAEEFIQTNKNILGTWFFKNRQVAARAAMILGDPAECWRNISLRLWSDMATRFFDVSHQLHPGHSGSDASKISVTQTLMSLDTRNWRTNLEMFAMSAKCLGDIDLLLGLKSLVSFTSLLEDDWLLVDLMVNNLNSQYSKTIDAFLESSPAKGSPKGVDQLSLIEFLNACVKLDKLAQHADKIQLVDSQTLRFLYEQNLAPTASNKIECEPPQIRRWMSTWSFNPSETNSLADTVASHVNLALLSVINLSTRNTCDKTLQNLTSEVADTRALESALRHLMDLTIDKNDCDIATLSNFLSFVKSDEATVNSNLQDMESNQSLVKAGRRNLTDQFIGRISGGGYSPSKQRTLHSAQLDTVRFNLGRGNVEFASKLANDLIERSPQDESVVFLARLALLDARSPAGSVDYYQSLIDEVNTSVILSSSQKRCILAKIFKRVFRATPSNLQNLTGLERALREVHLDGLEVTFGNGSEDYSLGTLNMITRCYDDQLNSNIAGQQSLETCEAFLELINASFKTDLVLLTKACGAKCLGAKRQHIKVETATRILSKIEKFSPVLSESNLDLFISQTSVDSSIDDVWFGLKGSIVSLVTCCERLTDVWSQALSAIMVRMATLSPESVLFETIVNRLDLDIKLSDCDIQSASEPAILLEPDESSMDDRKLVNSFESEDCRRKLAFWDQIYKAIVSLDHTNPDEWTKQVTDTVTFIREIRRISYLSGEFLKSLSIRLNRKLQYYLRLVKKYSHPETGVIDNKRHQDECRAKLDSIYQYENKAIEVLKTYLRKSKAGKQASIYDSSMTMKVWNVLTEMDTKFRALVEMEQAKTEELAALIESILALLSFCKHHVSETHQAFKRQLYMEQISPVLSRFRPDSVLMPSYFLDGSAGCSVRNSELRAPVTIHKIQQAVSLISSKTAPKKLTFIGSDGRLRAYLLKAHEDLRLDKLFMDLFGSINLLIGSDKRTRNYDYRLNRYAVTPVSNRSGLIQWVEAPSLCSFLRAWLESDVGRRTKSRLYKETCSSVCSKPTETNEQEHDCIATSDVRSVDLFHQLLWARMKNYPRREGAQAVLQDQIERPWCDTTVSCRQKFPPSLYEDVLEQLVASLPQNLIVNQLFFGSPHSLGFYARTQNFIRSTAVSSIVGYLVGLGDRHPDNILLDPLTGRVIHIDFNICFEVGHQQALPERVPFRLTQSMVQAFGFAGLEGGFKHSCRRVLDLLKGYKSVVLHHLDPIHLAFMIESLAHGANPANTELVKVGQEDMHRPGGRPEQQAPSAGREQTSRVMNESAKADREQRPPLSKRFDKLELCSQEDNGAADLLPSVINPRAAGRDIKAAAGALEQKSSQTRDGSLQAESTTNPAHIDIKTPKMISPSRASNIFERVKSKLTGNDELLLSKMYASRAGRAAARKSVAESPRDQAGGQPDDLILLIDEAQSTEDQVDALISEAISNKNKAAMYEGWSPWV